jgi:hypothetical protein
MTDPFQNAQEEYFRLRDRLANRKITEQQFQDALKQLTVQDAQGRYWTIAADSGQWLVHDGRNWVEATPPTMAFAPAATSQSAQYPPVKPPATPARGVDKKLLLTFGGAIAVCVVLILVVTLAARLGVVKIGPVPSLAPTPLLNRSTSTPTPAALASSNIPDVGVSIISVESPTPIVAKDFATLNAALAEKIAALNRAQLTFIHDINAAAQSRPAGLALSPLSPTGFDLTGDDLKDIAAKAMDVAIAAENNGGLVIKQNDGSQQATQAAEPYFNTARLAYSLVIDAQNVRQALSTNQMSSHQASETIAAYGAQLWNSAVTDGNSQGNPFSAFTDNPLNSMQFLNSNAAAQVQSQINAPASSIWIAQSAAQSTRTLNVVTLQSPVNPFDPQIKSSLATAAGQNDGNQAQQVAAANLQALGAQVSADPTTPKRIQVTTKSVAVSGGDQISSGNIPSFKPGTATVVATQNSNDKEDPILHTFSLDGEDTPFDLGKILVQDKPALVSLSLTNIVIGAVNKRAPDSGSFEADVNFSFKVNWSTTLASPQFTLDCNSSNSRSVTQTSGALALNANSLMILYPGTIDVFCYASSNGNTLGSVSVKVLVGEAAGATQRAVQVETDSVSLDLTLTADALGTSNALTAQAAATQNADATINAVSTEVQGTQDAEAKMTAAAFATANAQPIIPPPPSSTPTFTPKVVDTVFHPGNVEGVSTNVTLVRGHLYRFTFSGLVNLINPTQSVTANKLPEHVNGVAVSVSGTVVIEGTGSVAAITCGSGEPDPDNPGGYTIVVTDLGPH